MNKLAEVLDRPEPTMAVAFSQETNALDISGILLVADVAELRADMFRTTDSAYLVNQAKRLARIPVLATIRFAEEGGGWTRTEYERTRLFNKLLPHVEGIDIELAAEIAPRVVEAAHQQDKMTIVSAHNFTTTPSLEELEDKFGLAKEAGADYVKFAASAKKVEEFQRLAEFTLSHRSDNVIVVAMDDYGPLSRVAFPAMGSSLTYAFPGKQAVAPGQMDYLETQGLLNRFYPGYAELAA